MRPVEILQQVHEAYPYFFVCIPLILFFYSQYRGKFGVSGPFEWPIFGALPFLLSNRHDILRGILTYSRLYNFKTWTVKWIGEPRFFMTCDPRNLEHILKTNFPNYPKGENFRHTLTDLLGNGIFNSDGQQWKDQRHLFANIFSERSFQTTIMNAFIEGGEKLEKILDEAATTGTTLDVFALFNRFTLDSIGKIAFGADIGSLDDANHPFAAAFDEAQVTVDLRFFTPGWRFLAPFLSRERRLKVALNTMNDFCNGLIAERRRCKDLAERRDVLSRAMCMEEPEGTFPYRDNNGALRDIILNFLIAGRDTTAQALSWAILQVASHPAVEEELAGEALSLPTFPPPFEAVEKQLRVARSVTLETLRLFPSVPKDIKLCSKGDTLPDGTYIPSGTTVVYLPYVMGRSKELWGEDAPRFDPQRFITSPNPSPWKFPVFNGAGPRQCLGQRMAIVEACFVLSSIYRKFHLELDPLSQAAPDGCPYQDSLTLPPARGVRVKVRRRK